MDPLSATASCIAVVQILNIARSLFSTSQHALKDIDSINSELDSLKCLLEHLEAQEDKSDILVQTLDRCEGSLNTLRKNLEKTNRSSDKKKRWKWIFIKENVTETLDSVRGMQENLLLAMDISHFASFRDLGKQIVASNTSHQLHHLESSTGQQEIVSLIKKTVVPQIQALRGDLATSDLIQSAFSRRPSLLAARWTRKWALQFVLFDILIRTNDLRRCGKFIENEKESQQASSISLRFKPSTFVAWLVETAVVLDITWGNAIVGVTVNPQFYDQVPDSHQLIKATRAGNMSLVRNLISENSASASCMTIAGWTPLHFAAAKGHLDMCEFLISHGADLNAVGYIGMTPLHAAATFGQIEVMKLLITKGSDPNIFHDHGFHLVFQLFISANALKGEEKLALVDWVIRKQEYFEFDVHAVNLLHRNLTQVIIQSEMDTSFSGSIHQPRLVEALLKKRNVCLDNQDFEGSTALHKAATCGRLDLVERLLDGSATATIKDNRGRTPIHYAASLGNVAIVRRLVGESDAGINDKDVTGWTLLRLAVRSKHLDIVRLLINLGAHCDWHSLRDAIRSDAENSFDFLLTVGVKPSLRIMQQAICQENLHYLRNSILGGVSPNSRRLGHNVGPKFLGQFWTPLTYAAFQERPLALQLLLSMGADVNLQTYDGQSALLVAVRGECLESVDILLRAGAATHDLSLRNGQTMNLIDVTTDIGRTDIAELLYKAGAPKPAVDQSSASSSMNMERATIHNRVDILKELTRQGGNVNTFRDGRHTPFELACNRGSSEAAIFLIEAGLDLNSHHSPPLLWAAESGLTNVVQLLLRKGVDTNQLDFRGQTAMLRMLDVTWNHSPDRLRLQNLYDQTSWNQTLWIVKELILAGINVNVVNNYGHTALGMACWHGYTSIVEMLLEAGADISIPSFINRYSWGYSDDDDDMNIDDDHVDIYDRVYIDDHLDIDDQVDIEYHVGTYDEMDTDDPVYLDRKNRYLPLELAARAGHEDIVQLLLSKGADWRSLKKENAIATSHSMLVKHWFADDDDGGDQETTFMGCEPSEAQLKVSCPQDVQESDDDRIRHRIQSDMQQQQSHKAKRELRRYLIGSALFLLRGLQWIESWFVHLCVGMAAIIVVSLLLLYHKLPFSLLQRNWTMLRILLWAIILRYVVKVFRQ